jgi:hypothetical protein
MDGAVCLVSVCEHALQGRWDKNKWDKQTQKRKCDNEITVSRRSRVKGRLNGGYKERKKK